MAAEATMRLESSFAPWAGPAGRPLAVLAALAAGCSARVENDSGDASAGRPDFGIGLTPDRPSGLLCERLQSLPFRPHPADVLVLFDRSESMNLEFGERTRYEVAADILGDLLPAYDDKIRFGFEVFPAKNGCSDGVTGCCVQEPDVGVGFGTAGAVLEALRAAAPVSGNTPTARALRLAREHYAALNDGVDARYVLLSTDGVPSCTVDGELPAAAADACDQALAEVDALRMAKVKVIVLGLGPDITNDPQGGQGCLGELGRRGGLDRGAGDTGLFLASDREALSSALQLIFGAVGRPTCMVDLEREASDPAQVRVRFDGKEIPRSRVQGWEFYPPQQAQHLQLYGDYCRRLERFQVVKLEVEFGCTPCGEDHPCE